MFNTLENIIKKAKGNVLAIELDNKLLEYFDSNNKINLYSIYSNSGKINKFGKTSKKRQTNKGKSINIKRLRRYINKKSVDYLFCNFNEMIKYYKYIVKDSIYLTNQLIYIYANNDIEKEFILNKYKRYNVVLDITDYKNGYIIKINTVNAKNSRIKDFFYFIKDTFYNLGEMIGNILVS